MFTDVSINNLQADKFVNAILTFIDHLFFFKWKKNQIQV